MPKLNSKISINDQMKVTVGNVKGEGKKGF